MGEQASEKVRGGSGGDEEEDEGVRAGEFGEVGEGAGGDEEEKDVKRSGQW